MDFALLFIAFICIAIAFAIHEYAHGLCAYSLGDPTAKYEDRLTPNPLVHLDPTGSLVMLLSIMTTGGQMIMGWAKPVRFDMNNLKNPVFDAALIAFAGPFSNFVLAFLGGLPLLAKLVQPGTFMASFLFIFVGANLGFGLFNMLPVPPLDGWKILQAFMPSSIADSMQDIEVKAQLWALIVLLLIFTFVGDPILKPTYIWLRGLLTGYA